MKIDKIIDSNGSDVDKLIALFVKDHQYSLTKTKVDQVNKAILAVGFSKFCERLQELNLCFEVLSDAYGIELSSTSSSSILKLVPYKNKNGVPLPLKDFLKSNIEDRLADGFETYYIASFAQHLAHFLSDNEFVII